MTTDNANYTKLCGKIKGMLLNTCEDVECPVCGNRLWCQKCECTWFKDKVMFHMGDLLDQVNEIFEEHKTTLEEAKE